jgi:hypothetical protein
MLAQWISWAFRDGYRNARREPLITLGSAPLHVPEFRGLILGQLGEPRLNYAIDADIAGNYSHARALDSDTKGKGALEDIHRRVGATILFESSGGEGDQPAHQPELRFALGEPELDTTTIDNAADALEKRAFYLRKVGNDGYRFGFKPTLKKVVSDRRASLDEDEVKKATRALVKKDFERDSKIPVELFPEDSSEVEDLPRVRVVVLPPEQEWSEDGPLRAMLTEWTKNRGASPRLYPASLLWCARKPGKELRDKVENWLAWQRVQNEINTGTLAGDFDTSEKNDIRSKLKDAEGDARDEVWASYRFVILYENTAPDGLRVIDLGAGHSSSGSTQCGRVIGALTSHALLNESPGASWIDRRWPEAFKDTGAWPLKSLRQAFLDGSVDRLLDPDTYLRQRIPEFVKRGDLGFASGGDSTAGFSRIWFKDDDLDPSDVAFDPDVYLLRKATAESLKRADSQASDHASNDSSSGPEDKQSVSEGIDSREPGFIGSPTPVSQQFRLVGSIPSEVWNRLGTKLIPKLKNRNNLNLAVDLSFELDSRDSEQCIAELRQTLADLSLTDILRIKS